MAFAVRTAVSKKMLDFFTPFSGIGIDAFSGVFGLGNQKFVEIDIDRRHKDSHGKDGNAAAEQGNARSPHGGNFKIFPEGRHAPHTSQQHGNRQNKTDIPRQFRQQEFDDLTDGGFSFKKVRDGVVDITQDKENDKHQHQHTVFDEELTQDIPIQHPEREPAAGQSEKPAALFYIK